MKLRNAQGEVVIKQGVIVEVKEGPKDTSLVIECRWEDDLTNNERTDLIPVIRSPTALRQRRALTHLFKDGGVKWHEHKRRVLLGAASEATPEGEAGEFEQSATWLRSGVDPTRLTSSQQSAVKHVYDHRVSCLHGPPGCGKTAVIRYIVHRASHSGWQGGGTSADKGASMEGRRDRVLVTAIGEMTS